MTAAVPVQGLYTAFRVLADIPRKIVMRRSKQQLARQGTNCFWRGPVGPEENLRSGMKP
jgi:hypothetical protein